MDIRYLPSKNNYSFAVVLSCGLGRTSRRCGDKVCQQKQGGQTGGQAGGRYGLGGHEGIFSEVEYYRIKKLKM